MKAYMLTITQLQEDDDSEIDLLIGNSSTPERNEAGQPYMTVGAFRPGKDGNYYSQLFLGFLSHSQEYTPSFSEWWIWLKGAIQSGDVKMDVDFLFDLDDVKIIEIQIPIR